MSWVSSGSTVGVVRASSSRVKRSGGCAHSPLRSLLSGRRAPGHGWGGGWTSMERLGLEGAVVPGPSLDVCAVVVLVSRWLLSSGPGTAWRQVSYPHRTPCGGWLSVLVVGESLEPPELPVNRVCCRLRPLSSVCAASGTLPCRRVGEWLGLVMLRSC